MKHETEVHTIHCGTIFYATCSCNWQTADYLSWYNVRIMADNHLLVMEYEVEQAVLGNDEAMGNQLALIHGQYPD